MTNTFKIEQKDNFYRVRVNNKWHSSYTLQVLVDNLKRMCIPSTLIVVP